MSVERVIAWHHLRSALIIYAATAATQDQPRSRVGQDLADVQRTFKMGAGVCRVAMAILETLGKTRLLPRSLSILGLTGEQTYAGSGRDVRHFELGSPS